MSSLKFAFLLAGLKAVLLAAPTPSYTWQPVSQVVGFPKGDSSPNAALSFGGRTWILSGWNLSEGQWQNKSSVWMSADCCTWTQVNPAPPYDPYSAFVVFQGAMWAVAENVYRSVDGVTWVLMAKNVPIPISSRITVFKDRLWVSAGKTIWCSSDGLEWQLIVAEAPWGERQWPLWQAFKGYLWLIGGGSGYRTPAECYFNDTWRSEDGRSWERMNQTLPWSPRYWSVTAVHDDKLWLIAGWMSKFREDPAREYGNITETWFSTNGLDWEQTAMEPSWSARHAPYAWTHGGQLYLAGGYGGGGESRLYHDVWKLTPNLEPVCNDSSHQR